MAVLCGPESKSKKSFESAVLKLDDVAVHVATERHIADDSDRTRIILGNGTNDTHSVALLESWDLPPLYSTARVPLAGLLADVCLEHSEDSVAIFPFRKLPLFVVVELNPPFNGTEEF